MIYPFIMCNIRVISIIRVINVIRSRVIKGRGSSGSISRGQGIATEGLSGGIGMQRSE